MAKYEWCCVDALNYEKLLDTLQYLVPTDLIQNSQLRGQTVSNLGKPVLEHRPYSPLQPVDQMSKCNL